LVKRQRFDQAENGLYAQMALLALLA